MTDKKNIYQRILAVTDVIKMFEKDGTNARFNFKFAGIEQVVQTLQPVLIANGIALIQEAKGFSEILTITGSKGPVSLSACEVITHAVNVDDPTDRVTTTMPGHGFDTLDKGIYKAISGARKYAIFGLFNLHAGDEEPDAYVGKPAGKKATRSAAPPRQRPSQPAGPAVPVHAEEKRAKATGGPSAYKSMLFVAAVDPTTSKKGDPMLVVDFKIVSGEYAGQKAKEYLTFPFWDGQNEASFPMRKSRRLINCATGITYPTSGEYVGNLPALAVALQGKQIMADLKTDSYFNEYKNETTETIKIDGIEIGVVEQQTTNPAPAAAAPVPDDIGAKEAAAMDPDLDRDIDLEEDEDFFID